MRRHRILFVDLLRLAASFQMVVGHTVDGLLREDLRRGAVFEAWTSVRGLTAVSFMVAAGLSFHLSTLARFETHRADPAAVRRRLRRGVTLVVLGYLLHAPLAALFGDAGAALREFAIVDVLQCIGLSILTLEGLTLLARRPSQVVWACAALGVLAFGLGPLGDRIEPTGPWRFALNYLGHRGGSLFPVVPWAGFIFAGVALGAVALPEGGRTGREVPARRLALAALGLLSLGALTTLADVEGVTPNARPAFNLVKLGAVTGVVALLARAGRRISKLPPVAAVLSRETLALYVSHLMVLYAAGVGLVHHLGHTLSLAAALSVAGAMVAGTALAGVGWSRLKACLTGLGARAPAHQPSSARRAADERGSA